MKSLSRGFRLMSGALLCAFLLSGFLRFSNHMLHADRHDRAAVAAYFQDVDGRSEYVDLYGAVQRLLGKRQIENFTIFKNDYDKLVAPRAALDIADIERKLSEVRPMWVHLQELNVPFLYIEGPLPIADEVDLPSGITDHTHQNAALLHNRLEGIQTLDVSGTIAIPKEERFYRTDHHWSGDMVFETYQSVMEWLEAQELFAVDRRLGPDSFKRTAVLGFLGSYGVKVGRYYDGQDDYIYYHPEIPTHMICHTMDADGALIETHEGNWYEALMDASMLDDPAYNNKYNAALWGNGGENRIINCDREAGRLLIISHSYGRPLAQYLALHFHETRQIDPAGGKVQRELPVLYRRIQAGRGPLSHRIRGGDHRSVQNRRLIHSVWFFRVCRFVWDFCRSCCWFTSCAEGI